jgi:hypothetical protein
MGKTLEKKDGATRCRFCINFVKENSYCSKKKSSVAANKKRHCIDYILDSVKVDIVSMLATKALPTTRGVIDRGLRRELITKQNAAIRKANKEAIVESLSVTNESFPLTGDLSRFKTTGITEELVENNV